VSISAIKITKGDNTQYGYFKVSEFHPNSNPHQMDDAIGDFYFPETLLNAANLIRESLGHPVWVNSSIRTQEKNAALGGAKRSLHLPYNEDGKVYTRAVDLGISTGIKDVHQLILNNGQLAQQLREMGIGGIGIYDTFVHIDIGPERFWDNRVSTKVGMFNPTIIYYNIVNYLKKKDVEEEEDISEDMAEGFFRNPWFVVLVFGFVYYKFIRS
jgi:uncharacterized protein YcbK (DUF882 family)